MIQKSIKLNGQEIEYTLKVNKRSKSIKLSVHPGGRTIVTTPRYIPQFIINSFLKDKSEWLINKIEKFSKIKVSLTKNKKQQKEEYLKYKDIALKIVEERLGYFNKFYNFKWGRITIRNQKTRWGSCSKKGNLNFNYKIALLPIKSADYIIVHELCHLKEFNHGKNFWYLVSQKISDYKEIKSDLQKNGLKIN